MGGGRLPGDAVLPAHPPPSPTRRRGPGPAAGTGRSARAVPGRPGRRSRPAHPRRAAAVGTGRDARPHAHRQGHPPHRHAARHDDPAARLGDRTADHRPHGGRGRRAVRRALQRRGPGGGRQPARPPGRTRLDGGPHHPRRQPAPPQGPHRPGALDGQGRLAQGRRPWLRAGPQDPRRRTRGDVLPGQDVRLHRDPAHRPRQGLPRTEDSRGRLLRVRPRGRS